MSLFSNSFCRARKLTAEARRCYRKKCKRQAVDLQSLSGFQAAISIFPLLIAAVITAVIPDSAENGLRNGPVRERLPCVPLLCL
jgi:hypothetical protein